MENEEKQNLQENPSANGGDKAKDTGGLVSSVKKSAIQPDLDELASKVEAIREEIGKIVVGQDRVITEILAAVFSDGHVLIEGVPGIAKTLLAKLLARTIDAGFSRIQFTPDLMPSDVIGTNVFNVKTSEFEFKHGPVFSNIVLIDEINRAPAKTQSSLFEVMQEKQISVDGITYKLDFPFIVIATQNPIEQEGTYKLPEAQLDRFLFRILMDYPSLSEEESILLRFRNEGFNRNIEQVNKVLSKDDLKRMRTIVNKVHIEDSLVKYIAKLIHNTRNHPGIFLGASPRASLAIMQTAKAIAAMNGRDFVTPEDVQYVSGPVLNHRVILTPDREMEGFEVSDVIREISEGIEVPR